MKAKKLAKFYKDYLEKSFNLAEDGKSKIDEYIKEMQGMTGIKTRHLYNLIMSMPDSRYLEIGTWKGSSVCSAICGNSANVTCIDNWCQFFGAKEELLSNIERYKGSNSVEFIESDCFSIDCSKLGNFNVYMYDGDHSQESHHKALSYFIGNLDETFIYIVDDWNYEMVRNGTFSAIEELKLTVFWKKEIITRGPEDDPVIWNDPDEESKNNWWNGIAVFVLVK